MHNTIQEAMVEIFNRVLSTFSAGHCGGFQHVIVGILSRVLWGFSLPNRYLTAASGALLGPICILHSPKCPNDDDDDDDDDDHLHILHMWNSPELPLLQNII